MYLFLSQYMYLCTSLCLSLCTSLFLNLWTSPSVRGVQYVHWVMHKCIMVKVGGNEIHIKYVKSR